MADKHDKPNYKGDTPPPTDNPVDDANNWNNNLGSTIGGFCQAIVQADGQAKDAAMARILNLLKVPNAQFIADASMVGQKDPLQIRIDTPVISLTRTDAVIIEEATIEMEMNVSSSVADASTQDVKGEGSGSASVGWGPFKASIQVSASMASHSEHQRKSDFRSRTHCAVKMVQGEPAEGLSLIMESVNKFVNTATEINKQIVEAQLSAVLKDAQDNSKTVPPPNGK
ncbi:MAG: DUF2589 domain-containing protein [Acidimicrobiaceae bacterium]|nr:DUF2589 domain-containing protein [Candidatus Poribacteria bacterium]MYI36858.1 DUF2589 domain-containing protein [Acidimicrobiaceae bacterium]